MKRSELDYRPPRALFRRFELLSLVSGGRAFCEIGAGDLTLARELLARFDRGTVVDLHPTCLEIHASFPPDVRDRLAMVIGNAEDLIPSERFDCVVCCEVLEHVRDDRAMLVRLLELLAPGGVLVLSVPSRMKYWSVHDDIVGHRRRYERDALRELLESAGFSDVEIRSYGFPWVNLLRLPRRLLARHQAVEREIWDCDRRTLESNHRQIPGVLTRSPIRLLTRPSLIAPLAAVSRLFVGLDLSDGYVVRACRT